MGVSTHKFWGFINKSFEVVLSPTIKYTGRIEALYSLAILYYTIPRISILSLQGPVCTDPDQHAQEELRHLRGHHPRLALMQGFGSLRGRQTRNPKFLMGLGFRVILAMREGKTSRVRACSAQTL